MFAGLDGCRDGWIAGVFDQNETFRFQFFGNLEEAFETLLKKARFALIDIPVGLRTKGAGERSCEPLARHILQARKSSVFSVPVREVLYRARNYPEASAINFRHSGKKISLQTWNICPKIREADKLFRRFPALTETLAESHPELCFAAFNGGVPMKYSKKSSPQNKNKGFLERVKVLQRYLDFKKSAKVFSEKGCPGRYLKDDLVDAAVLAISAKFIKNKKSLVCLPENPPRDEFGIPMRMVYPNVKKQV